MGNVSQKFLSNSPKEIAIPAVALFELEYGIAKSSSPLIPTFSPQVEKG